MKMPFLLISPKIVPKIQLIKKGGCFEYHAVIADKIKYRYVHRASICPALGMDRRSFFMPKPMGKYKRLEVFYLSKPVYTADKPSDCHYCYFWTNGRKGCRLGRNNCYYLISLPPKPKSECDGCPYGRDHPCIGWCTKKVMREVGLALVMHDEGKLVGKELNRALRDDDGDIYDIIAGDFLVVGLGEDDFCSLSPELMKQFEEHFHQPETFVRMGRSIMALPLPDDMVKKEDAPVKADSVPHKSNPDRDVL